MVGKQPPTVSDVMYCVVAFSFGYSTHLPYVCVNGNHVIIMAAINNIMIMFGMDALQQ